MSEKWTRSPLQKPFPAGFHPKQGWSVSSRHSLLSRHSLSSRFSDFGSAQGHSSIGNRCRDEKTMEQPGDRGRRVLDQEPVGKG